MKTAGMFLELSQGAHAEPRLSIRDHVAPEPLPDSDQVVTYLRSGYPLIDMMDTEADVLDPAQEIWNGSSILTDGDWLWRKDLTHYVRRHHVRLPDEFLQLIRSRQYVVPDVPVEKLAVLAAQAHELAFGPNEGVTPGSEAT